MAERPELVPALQRVATEMRLDSIRSTTQAGSGHPTTCCSAADIAAVLFFAEMRYDPKNPRDPDNDRFVLSKGHAAPLLYSAWAHAGYIDRADLIHLREITSDLEGHPTPRLAFVDVATGSLGQGLGVGVGMALNARRIRSPHRTFVLMGDGETAEGSVWEAAEVAGINGLDSLCATVDVNALGQSRATAHGHDLAALARRWEASGWRVIQVDGHDIAALLTAFADARTTTGRPTVLLAKTIKGKGVSFTEGSDGWHGRPFKKGEEVEKAIAELEARLAGLPGRDALPPIWPPAHRTPRPAITDRVPDVEAPTYKPGDMVATREAIGSALVKLGRADDRVVALDADVKNSTFTDKFEAAFPERFYQSFIAEQAMLGMSMGLASRGAIAFAATFAAFLTRAYDFIRMAAISNLDIKLVGSHVGVSIGEDGPSQMGLEDLAMMRAQPNITVLYPSDAVSAERLAVAAAFRRGPTYIRTSRPKTPILYANQEQFPIGGSKVLRHSDRDLATVVAAGITVFEALKAFDILAGQGKAIRVIDAYSVQPLDATAILAAGRATEGRIVVVEDHYARGGIGEAVAAVLAAAGAGFTLRHLAVREIPRSGKPDELLDRFGISAAHIVRAVIEMVG